MKKEQELKEAAALLAKKPSVKLGFFPTPLYKLEHLSKKYGVDLYIKRDDLTGPGLFGGNKIRKLEFLLGEAKKQGADYILTYGAAQSNHAMQTVTACRKLGLKPLLYLISVVPPDTINYRGNLLINKIMDAEAHIITPRTGAMEQALAEAQADAARRMQELEKEGHRCFEIPAGGASPVGTLGFIKAYLEMASQLARDSLGIDYLYHATGTGGTFAGLLAGKKLFKDQIQIVPVDVGLVTPGYENKVARLTREVLSLLGQDEIIPDDEIQIEKNYSGPGYELPSAESSSALKLLAREEGILVGPVYTAKALAAVIDHVREGKIAKGSRVLYWHTGGVAELFAEAEMVGSLTD